MLKLQLSELIISTHETFIPYTSTQNFDTWDLIKTSDTYLLDNSKVLLVYGYDDNDVDFENDFSRDKSLSCHGNDCEGLWNREHIYPKSLATPVMTTSFPGTGTDVHNLRSCDYVTNSTRSNLIFGDGDMNSGLTTSNSWYPGEEWKGDIARIIMYMYLRYPLECNPLNVGDGPSDYAPNNDIPDIFLNWNSLDPVSEFEENRNEIIFNFQVNRNPFIDNPYLATLIWSGPQAEDKWVGVETNNLNFEIDYKLSPNPVRNNLKISSKHLITYTLLYDMKGSKILVSHGDNINLGEVPKGIYFLEIYSLNNYNSVKKKVVIY
jgi:endonuclease I